jgi:hypothetical protein
MTKLNDEVKKFLQERRPALVATAGKSGKPNVSVKGLLKVLDDEHVAFADIASPRTMANLVENPQVAIIVFDPATRKGCRLWGKTEILDSGADFEAVTADVAKMKMRVKHLVKVTLEQVESF